PPPIIALTGMQERTEDWTASTRSGTLTARKTTGSGAKGFENPRSVPSENRQRLPLIKTDKIKHGPQCTSELTPQLREDHGSCASDVLLFTYLGSWHVDNAVVPSDRLFAYEDSTPASTVTST